MDNIIIDIDGKNIDIREENEKIYHEFSLKQIEAEFAAMSEDIERLKKIVDEIFPEEKFGILNKYFFKRKQYKYQLQRIQEKTNNPRFFMEEVLKNNEAMQIVEKLQKIYEKYGYELDKTKAIMILLRQDMQFDLLRGFHVKSYETMLDKMVEFQLPIKFKSYEEALTTLQDTLPYDVEFMKKAITDDMALIGYDKTQDPELYCYLIDLILDSKRFDGIFTHKVLSFETRETLKKYKEELRNPKKVSSGKYKIPHKYMYEELNKFIMADEPWKFIFKYLANDGLVDEEFGKEMEQLYEETDVTFGLHAGSNNPETYMTTGIKTSTQSSTDAFLSVGGTVALKGDESYLPSFITVLDYSGLWTAAEDLSVCIMMLPDDAEYIWVTDNPESDKESSPEYGKIFISPEYIYGVIKCSKDGVKIIKNDHLNDKNYRYIRTDGEWVEKGKKKVLN